MRSLRLIVVMVVAVGAFGGPTLFAGDLKSGAQTHQLDGAFVQPAVRWVSAEEPPFELPALEDPVPIKPKLVAPEVLPLQPEAARPKQPAAVPQPDAEAAQPDPTPPSPPAELLPATPLEPPRAAEESAATGPTLSLEELVEIAMESNPTLMQATAAIQAAEGGYVQASLYPNPTIAYQGADIGLDGTSGQQGMGVSQEIVTSNKRLWATAVAEAQIQQAQFAWESQRRRVINGARAGFYEVLLAQRTIDVNKELVNIAQQGVELTEKRLAARTISKAELLQTQIEAEMAELSLNQANNNHAAAWRRLTAMLGRPDMEKQRLAGEVDKNLPQFYYRETLEHLMTQSPELAQAHAAVETARNNLALQCAARIPNLQVATGVKYDESARFTLADVGISVPLPVFNRNQGNIMAAQSRLAAAQNEVQRVELDLRSRLADAFEQYSNSTRQIEAYSGSIVPNAQESLRLADIGYRAGHFDYLTLLTAQRTYFGVSLEYLQSLKGFWARAVELEGMLLGGGLESP